MGTTEGIWEKSLILLQKITPPPYKVRRKI
jgi:hypothetical protein